MSDLVIVAAGQEAKYLPSDVNVVLTGIGMAQAAVATTRAILEHQPTRVVNLGSVGSLDPSIHGIQRPSAVINRDLNADALRAAGLTPDERIELSGDGPVLGTGDSFVAGGPERDALIGRCQLVDMEGFAIAHACRVLGVELVMVKHVSDPATEESLGWKELVDVSARALAETYAAIRR
ncbi:nucleosidase [Tessaracoccus rhinocerotis]|uniref:Nucleosidase n=1 Tax=Tessaracoccus rhinocerotis TaxID=1689449 RepID=A0A553JXF0_9ACTN|nr:nucleosidase [Tessaracoccus rhinocerotis]TRY17126.1 nucleosidase [Tessaracoccus rhinocerotis]